LRILIVKLSAIGDVVHTLPLLEVLKGCYPDAAVDWVVEEDAAALIEGHPLLERVIVSRRKGWQRGILTRKTGRIMADIKAFSAELRRFDYDIILDVQGLLKSGIITGLARGRRKIGLSDSREMAGIFLNEPPVEINWEDHAIDRYLRMADRLGCSKKGWDGRIPIDDRARDVVTGLLKEQGAGKRPIAAINPVAKWDTKLWNSKGFAKVADAIMDELGCDVVFTGSRADLPVIEEICGMMRGTPMVFAGRTNLKELACLLGRCSVLVTTDTGPMHMAAAEGCPVVALFGPTSPRRTGPYGTGHRIVSAGSACSPCYRRRCYHKTCMNDIKSRDVIEAVSSVLAQGGRACYCPCS
jgi:3-deoxy-D-manno-octulosonic-acid transferase/heptosyltransferase-1